MSMTESKAKIELATLEAQYKDIDKVDIISKLSNQKLPLEVVTRMQELWDKTKSIAGQVFSIGKIILIKIWEFISNNKHLALGVAIGAAIGALVNLIPLIGSFIAPLAIAVGAFIGGVAGMQLDKVANGQLPSTNVFDVFGDAINIAVKFFKLLADIFKAVSLNFAEI